MGYTQGIQTINKELQGSNSALLIKGNEFSRLKRYEEAIEQYKLAIHHNPSYSNAYNNMGFALNELNRYEEAIEQCKLAIRHNPSNSTAYNNMGNALKQLKRYEEAIEQYKLAIRHNPSYSTAYNNMGLALNELKRYEEAIEQYKLAVHHNPSYSNAYNNMGFALNELKRYEEAIEQYKLAVHHNPSNSTAYNNMGNALKQLKRYEEAIEQYKLSIHHNPSYSDSHNKELSKRAKIGIGNVLAMLGRYDEAEEYEEDGKKGEKLFDNNKVENGKVKEDCEIENIIQLSSINLSSPNQSSSSILSQSNENNQNNNHNNSNQKIHMDDEGIKVIEYQPPVGFIEGYTPPRSCADHILSDLIDVLPTLQNSIRYITDQSIRIAKDRLERINNLQNEILLSKDEAIAIAAYSFDLGYHSKLADGSDNLHKILNNVLRERNGGKMKKLQGYLYYLLTALSKLNAVKGVVYRGIPSSHKQIVENLYKLGSKIHWSAFTSTSLDLSRAKVFAEGSGGIIFRIKCQRGRNIKWYSSIPIEDRVLLSPNCRLFVSEELHMENDGYYYVDFVEMNPDPDNFAIF